MKNKYSNLTEATNLLLERELQAHRQNVAESARLAAEMAQIDGLREAAQADSGAIGARQILGADALWQGWLVRKRAQILRDVAMARAQETDSLSQARMAFSRAEAAKNLTREETNLKKKRRLKVEAETLDALGMLRLEEN